MLEAPTAMFVQELARLPAPTVTWVHVPSEGSPANQSMLAELADLRAALRKSGARDIEGIVSAHRTEREKAAAKFDGFDQRGTATGESLEAGQAIKVVEGLPNEFAEYFRGWLALKEGRTNDAIKAFEVVLALPEKERRYKAVWAAYMLGRAQQGSDPDKAVASFQLARALAQQGCSDSIGLAAASVGWEAKTHRQSGRFVRAIQLYREQFASGDFGALTSLKWTVDALLEEGGEALSEAAANATARRVVTAYLISHRYVGGDGVVLVWLELMEQVAQKDVVLAEELALLAYQRDEFDVAQRWVGRAGKATVSEWIRSKLLLRAGRKDEAGKILASVISSLPSTPRSTNDPAPSRLADTIEAHYRLPGLRAQGELGVLKLIQGRYEAATELLLKADFWSDAAYVAERIMSLDELKSYVDRTWPDSGLNLASLMVLEPEPTEAEQFKHDELVRTESTRQAIRSLLGRRLVRNSRAVEAREYFPEMERPAFDDMLEGLKAGEDESSPKENRAQGWWRAAQVMREHGIELIATECDPDWAENRGDFEGTAMISNRVASESLTLFVASADELRRARGSLADPAVRFHYRYQAAFIGMEAAKLLPDNDELTAKILYTAGCWLKDREPKVADIFYKALVRRCRKTELGRAADVKRWFPPLDDEGHPIVGKRPSVPRDEDGNPIIVDPVPDGIMPP